MLFGYLPPLAATHTVSGNYAEIPFCSLPHFLQTNTLPTILKSVQVPHNRPLTGAKAKYLFTTSSASNTPLLYPLTSSA